MKNCYFCHGNVMDMSGNFEWTQMWFSDTIWARQNDLFLVLCTKYFAFETAFFVTFGCSSSPKKI